MNEEVNTNEVSQIIEKNEQDIRRMITAIIRFSINEQVRSGKKIKHTMKKH